MSTSSETHERLTAAPRPEAVERAGPPPRPAAPERHPFPALPTGWAVIGRCRFGTGGPGPHATGCYALAHPDVGVALIDIAPNATPNAEARLRRALTAAEFWSDFPGTLPVTHERVDGTGLRGLPWLLGQGFAALPALTVPGGGAWIEGVQRAMAADSAWELPGQPKAAPDAPAPVADDGDAAPPPKSRPASHRRWRVASLPLAFAATFAVGVVSGFLLQDSPAPVVAPPPPPSVVAALPQSPAAPAPVPAEAAPRAAEPASAAAPTPAAPAASNAAPPASAESATAPTPPATAVTSAPIATPVSVAAPASAPSAPPTPAAAPTPRPATTAAPAAAPSPRPAPPLAAEAPPASPAEAPAVQQTAASTGGGGASAAPSPLETPVSHASPVALALPKAPPRAPAAPARSNTAQQSPRPTPVVDRACTQALFRFQQGERLTAAEQTFVRTGCSTARR